MEMEKVEKAIKSFLISAAREGGRSGRELGNDYRDVYQSPIPVRDLGFSSLQALFDRLEDDGVIKKNGRLSKLREPLYSCSDPLTRHLERQVQGQKKTDRHIEGKKGPSSLMSNQQEKPRGRSAPAYHTNRARGRGHYHSHSLHINNRTASAQPASYGNFQPQTQSPWQDRTPRLAPWQSRQARTNGQRPSGGVGRRMAVAFPSSRGRGHTPLTTPQSSPESLGSDGSWVAASSMMQVTVNSGGRNVSVQREARRLEKDHERASPVRKEGRQLTKKSERQTSSSGGRRLPPIGVFAQEMKTLLGSLYPRTFLVTHLPAAYREMYGEDFDVDTKKYFCKSMHELVQGLFQGFCEARGSGDTLEVRCKPDVAKHIPKSPPDFGHREGSLEKELKRDAGSPSASSGNRESDSSVPEDPSSLMDHGEEEEEDRGDDGVDCTGGSSPTEVREEFSLQELQGWSLRETRRLHRDHLDFLEESEEGSEESDDDGVGDPPPPTSLQPSTPETSPLLSFPATLKGRENPVKDPGSMTKESPSRKSEEEMRYVAGGVKLTPRTVGLIRAVLDLQKQNLMQDLAVSHSVDTRDTDELRNLISEFDEKIQVLESIVQIDI